MRLLNVLGLGKDPYVQWLVEAYGCEAAPYTVKFSDGEEQRWRWTGHAHALVLSVLSRSPNKWLGTGDVGLRNPALESGAASDEHSIALWRAGDGERGHAGIDDPFWEEQLRVARENPEWPSTMPDEAFEQGIALGKFLMSFDCPGDARPLLPLLPGVRDIANRFSAGVSGFDLCRAAIWLQFGAEGLTRDTLLADVQVAARIVQLVTNVGR